MTTQQLASLFRQAIALAALVVGPLTAALPAIQLPPAVSTAITVAGIVILAIEHFVSDPSTGNGTVTVAPATLASLEAEAEAAVKKAQELVAKVTAAKAPPAA